MKVIRVSTIIPADPKRVWDRLARLDTHAEWMKDAESITFLGPARSGVGTRMEVATRIGPFRTRDLMEVTRWEPEALIEVAHRGVFRGWGRFSLDTVPEGTRIIWEEAARFPWWWGGPLAAVIARPILRRVWRGNLARLAAGF